MKLPLPEAREVAATHLRPLPDVGPPGTIASLLAPFVHERRLARMRQVLSRRTRHLAVLLEEVHDPHNVAACVRSCDAFGVQHVHIVTPRGKRPKAARGVSRGSDRWLTLHVHADIGGALAALQAEGYLIAATDLVGEVAPIAVSRAPLDAPLCVAFGNEHDGISDTLRAAADLSVQIPMVGFVDSLNISVACATALYVLRDRLEAAPGGVPPLADAEQTELLDRYMLEDLEQADRILATLLSRRSAASAI